MPKVSEAWKEERRQHLLQCAMKCFAEKGFEATSVDEIVKEAGMSKGGIYNYFSSKEELFVGLIERRLENADERYANAFAPLESASDKLIYLLRSIEGWAMEEEQKKWALLFWQFEFYAQRRPELKGVLEKNDSFLRDVFQSVIREGVASGEFHGELDVETATQLFWMLRDGIILHFALAESQPERVRKVLDQAEKMLLGYLKSPV